MSKVPQSQIKRFDAMLKRPENRECFDCTSKQPRWASTNLGIFFCLRCAGIHRSLGVHISKVKSTNMDTWEEDMMICCERIGNGRGKILYEAKLPQNYRKPDSNVDVAVIEKFLRQKYEMKLYYAPDYDALRAQFLATPLTPIETQASPMSAVSKSSASPISNDNWSSLKQSSPSYASHTAPAPACDANRQSDDLWGDFTTSPVDSAPGPKVVTVADLWGSAGGAPGPTPNTAPQSPSIDFFFTSRGSTAAKGNPPQPNGNRAELMEFGPTAEERHQQNAQSVLALFAPTANPRL